MSRLLPRGAVLALLLACVPSATRAGSVTLKPSGSATFYDLSALTAEELVGNRYGREIPLKTLTFEIYLNDSDLPDVNIPPAILGCICPAGDCANGRIPTVDNPIYEPGDPCHPNFHDYSLYRFFDYGDPTPDAESFALAVADLRQRNPNADPMPGTLLEVWLDPFETVWASIYPPGLILKGANQYNPDDCPLADPIECGKRFRSAAIYRMGVDFPGQLTLFIPSVLVSPYTTKRNPLGISTSSSFTLGLKDPENSLFSSYSIYRPGVQPQGAAIYQTPLCVRIFPEIQPQAWSQLGEIRIRADFGVDPTRVPNPPFPTISSVHVSDLLVNQPPPIELRSDYRLTLAPAPLWTHPLGAGETADILVGLGGLTLSERRPDLFNPKLFRYTSGGSELVEPTFSIRLLVPGATLASDLMDTLQNSYVETRPTADAGFTDGVLFSFDPNVVTVSIQDRIVGLKGEFRFLGGLARFPRQAVIDASLAGGDGNAGCFSVAIDVMDYSEACRTILVERVILPGACVNPTTVE